ncbi:MAG: BlaR1 family beta-lactam sensor/signal transducer [Lachnospiraceae bacterium]|nr:BlaR1 family beta-lactam sensor/signal transducer [Lachnospiraceae bacterium]
MADFMMRFFISNLPISGIICILLIAKRSFKSMLSARMQYHLWFLLPGLLIVPFLPFHPVSYTQLFSWLARLGNTSASHTDIGANHVMDTDLSGTTNWINDFALSVNSKTPSFTGYILFAIWIVGMFVVILLAIKSALRLCSIRKSALPLQNPEVRRLYNNCLDELKITRIIPIYSTAYLRSPIMVGFLNPQIYLPIHLISDYQETEIRYILLHELQHYRHHDAIAGFFMNLTGMLYWFNPFIWFALDEMRNDREIACDTSVLKMLDENDYADYGNTLINFIEKVSFSPFLSAAGLSGNKKQIKRRIINIASYEKPTFYRKLKGMTVFILTIALILGLAPCISTYAADESQYHWNTSIENISYADFSEYFGAYEGSFVLYDLRNDTWSIHDLEHATLRVSPDSTYKIYDALLGLEKGIITPKDSFLAWDGTNYPFEAWNNNQTLQSAMSSSVNWYFQSIDEQLTFADISQHIHQIGYGNENVSSNLSTYWMESSLKISPVEQVELLIKLQNNSLGFSTENINAVKDAICLSTSNVGALYGKTGTGRIDGQDVNGWFVGYVETADNTYFFATNIKADSNATGSNANKITMSILSDMNIWQSHTTGM